MQDRFIQGFMLCQTKRIISQLLIRKKVGQTIIGNIKSNYNYTYPKTLRNILETWVGFTIQLKHNIGKPAKKYHVDWTLLLQ